MEIALDPALLQNVTPVSGWTAFGVLAFLILRSVISGTLIPVSTFVRELSAAIKRGDEWRETALALQESNDGYVKALGIASDFFHKIPVTSNAHPGDNSRKEAS